jgi:hypothetical protein
MHQTSSDWQNIYRVQDHEFHVFLSPIKHDIVLDMNCLLYDLALMVVVVDDIFRAIGLII